MVRALTALVTLFLPYLAYACSEGGSYPSPVVDKTLLLHAWTGEINEYLNTRYGGRGWQRDEKNLIVIETPQIPDNFEIVPVSVNWPSELNATSIDIIEVAKVTHTVSTFTVATSVNSIAFRYKRLQKQSRLIAVIGDGTNSLVSAETTNLVGGHPCAGTVYISSLLFNLAVKTLPSVPGTPLERRPLP